MIKEIKEKAENYVRQKGAIVPTRSHNSAYPLSSLSITQMSHALKNIHSDFTHFIILATIRERV